MGVEHSGRHTLRWCSVAGNIIPRVSQTTGQPCPGCGVELPAPYVALESDGEETDRHAGHAGSFSFSAAPGNVVARRTASEVAKRRLWEGPLVVVVSLLVVLVGLTLLPPRWPAVAVVDPADLLPGFEAHVRPSAGFAIALPDTWSVADLGDGGPLEAAGEAADMMSDETLSRFQALTATDVEFKLLAWGDDGLPGFTVITRSRARHDTVARVKYSVESALIWSYGIFDPGFQLLDVDGHDTLRFTYSTPVPAGELHVVQYVVMRGSSLLTARFHVTSPEADYRSFDTIINTLQTTG